jgi:hypothetical protein
MEIEDILMRNERLILQIEALSQQIEDLKNGLEGSCRSCEPVGEMNKRLSEELATFSQNQKHSENTEGKEALEYFKNLTLEPHGAIMSLEDMEKVIKFHEDELAEEDKRVKGTNEYPNYGDDFADMVYIARRLLDHVKTQKQEIEKVIRDSSALAANQCHAGYAGEYGHHRCAEIDRLTEERDEARREICGYSYDDPRGVARDRGWDCFKENDND